MPATTIHLRPTAPIAPRVLLPGDPGRALELAQALLDEPRMCNHNRGLWGYTGTAPDGALLTVQSTGMGGPSAAIVLAELIELGVRAAVRVGTCGALGGAGAPGAVLALGDLLVVRAALAADGTSRALGAQGSVATDARLTQALERHARTSRDRPAHSGVVATTDLFYDPDPARFDAWVEADALAVEMEAAALCALGARSGVAVGCVLVVTDLLDRGGRRARIGDEPLREAVDAMGAVALAALS